MNDRIDQGLACVDPKVGERILELALPTPVADTDERRLLTAHAEVCAYCRLTLDLHRSLAEGLADGSLTSASARVRNQTRIRDWTGWAAVAAIAASLACLLLLPPRAVGPSLVLRGGPDESRFLRPVEGEVVGGSGLNISWTAMPGADSYRIRLTGGPDDFAWTAETSQAHLVIPASADLPPGETFRVLLSTVPADLMPPGGISVSFRTGGTAAVASHRIRQAQPIVFLLAFAGLGCAMIAGVYRRSLARA